MTQDETSLQKSYGEYTQVEKPVVVTTSYEGSDKEEELEVIPVVDTNNSINYTVSDSDSDSSEEDFKNRKDNFFNKNVNDQVEISLHMTVNAMVVEAMKSFKVCIMMMPTKSSNKL